MHLPYSIARQTAEDARRSVHFEASLVLMAKPLQRRTWRVWRGASKTPLKNRARVACYNTPRAPGTQSGERGVFSTALAWGYGGVCMTTQLQAPKIVASGLHSNTC
jgi:hypothetical protein